MSDPVTNIEIEDVLSSIRRLVTDEGRPGARKSDLGGKVAATRLVLTPALRVHGGDTADQDLVEPEPANSQPPLRLDASYSASNYVDEIEFRRPSARVAETDDVDAGDGPGAETGDTSPPWADPDTTLHQAAAIAAVDSEDTDATEAAEFEDTEETGAPEFYESDADAGTSKDQADPAARIEDWGVTSVAEPAAGAVDLTKGSAETEDATAMDPAVAEVTGEPAAETAPGVGTTASELSQRTDTLSAKIQALEAAIAQQQDQWEPDSAGEDDYAGMPARETIPWQDHQPAPTAEVADAEVAEETQPENTGVLAADESVIDEEALRELVADIVRQELQGALGERITRNVRKLVRREIHRALAAQTME